MRIGEAAGRLGLSPRMLRYREALGLLPPARDPVSWPRAAGGPGAGVPRGPRAARGQTAGGAGVPRGPRAARGQTAGGAGVPRGPRAARGQGAGGAGGPEPPAAGPGHRRFGEEDLAIATLALELERRLDVSPAELAFGIRVLADPAVRAEVAGLARRLGRIPPLPGRALDFEQERALRLLGRAAPGSPRRPAPPAAR